MKKRVLVVEDDVHIRLGLRDALQAEGYDVTECRDGAQAGPLVKQHKPDLVILDIMLPGKAASICAAKSAPRKIASRS